jgi:streptogramin lyase
MSGGNEWLVDGSDNVQRRSPAGTLTPFYLAANSAPNDIAAASDGTLWATEYGTNETADMERNGDLRAQYSIPMEACGSSRRLTHQPPGGSPRPVSPC